MHTCQACLGQGEITFMVEYDPGRPWSDHGPAEEERAVTCTDCNGSGEVDTAAHDDQTERGGHESCRESVITLELWR